MTVTLTGKIVAIVAIVAILILGLGFRKYKKLTDSILREQDRQIKYLKGVIEFTNATVKNWEHIYEIQKEELEIYKKAEEARKLDEKMLLSKQDDNSTTQDLEF